MKKHPLFTSVPIVILAVGVAVSGADRYALRVPGGLAFSEFKGYPSWAVVAMSENGGRIAVILGNQTTINAYRSGIPANGKPFPDGSKMAKIHWNPKTQAREPGQPTVPGTLHDVDFMVKDSKRFADSGGWGWGAFEYNAATGTFRAANATDKPPQGNDARCGFACHTIVKSRDFVFTEYPRR